MQVQVLNTSASKLRNEKVDIFGGYKYSEKDSLLVYEQFLKQVGYADETIRTKMRTARGIHRNYSLISSLQRDIKENGIIGFGFNKDESAYIHFLCMIGLLDIKCSDYFNVNPKTIIKLRKWYEPYFEELGVLSYLSTVEDVIERNNNRVINLERTLDRATRATVYLLMRYHLHNIDDITQEQWDECLKDIKSIAAKMHNMIPNTIMGQAFFERGVLKVESASHYIVSDTKERSYDDLDEIRPIVWKYIEYIEKKFAHSTCAHKITAIDHFFAFARQRRGFKSLENVSRSMIRDFKIQCTSKGYSSSYVQAEMYGVKNFLEYVEANKQELISDGYKVPKKRVLVNKDFHIKTTKYQPRPIDPDVLVFMIETLKSSPYKQFSLAFLLMLTTGIGLAELLNLKQDCVKEMADGSKVIRIYRKKAKKYYEVKIRPETVRIIQSLQELNTQKVPLKHPDGTEAFYLINDRGVNLSRVWFTGKFNMLKKQLANEHPELEKKIMAATPHRLRHSFATRMRDNGADIYTLAYLLGHENINTTKKYVKESDRIKQEYIDRLNEKYVCDAVDDISKLTGTERGLQVISDMLNFKNNVGIGQCLVNGYENCPMAYQCVDCIYLCSTVEDIPEMMDMLQGLKDSYDELMDEGEEIIANSYRKKALRLAGKIKVLEEQKIDIPEIAEIG